MKLWIFGDSYSADNAMWNSGQTHGIQQIENPWYKILATSLKVDEIKLVSKKGVANDWIYSEVIKHQPQFQKDDYVVIQLTSRNRQWFFPEYPELSNIFNSKVEYNNKEHSKAVDYYVKHLHHDLGDIIRYDMLVCALQFMAKTFEGFLKILIIPGFNDVPGVKGNLGNICSGEFFDNNIQDKYYHYHRADPRINHMHEENHIILANKIFNFFISYKPVDLTVDFKSKFINISNYKKVTQTT